LDQRPVLWVLAKLDTHITVLELELRVAVAVERKRAIGAKKMISAAFSATAIS